MARFFKTAPTQFVEDYIYQPPWEMMQKAAAEKQQTYDLALASAKLFNNIPIDHLQGEDDVYNVKEKQRYYAESAANIAKAIQNDPARAKQYMSNIEALQNELQKDMTSGDLSHIVGSAQAFKKWQEDNKKMKEDDPARYAAAERTYLADYINAGGNSISQRFRGDLVTKDVDWQKLYDSVDKLKATEWSKQSAGASGGYIYKNKSTGETVSADRINGYLMSRLLTPQNMAALQQSQQYGLARYFDDKGNLDEKAPGFAGIRGVALTSAYSNQSQETDMQSDGTYNAAQSRALTYQMHKEDAARDNYWKGVERADKINKLAAEGQLTEKDLFELRMDILEETDPKIRELKQQEYDNLTGKQVNAAVDKKVLYTDIYGAAAVKGVSGVSNVVGEARNAARKGISAEDRKLAAFIDSNIANGKIKKEEDIQKYVNIYITTNKIGEQDVKNSKLYTALPSQRNARFGQTMTKEGLINSSISGLTKKYTDFAKNYINKQNNFISNYANQASSQKAFEVPSVTSSNQGAEIIKRNPTDFIMTFKNEKGENVTTSLLPQQDIKIKAVASGNSYGPLAISATVQGRDVYILPSAEGVGGVSVQTLQKILSNGLRTDSTIRNSLQNTTLNDLQQAESRAGIAEGGNVRFTYKVGGKEFRINKINGVYKPVDEQANPIVSDNIKITNLDQLARYIDLKTNE